MNCHRIALCLALLSASVGLAQTASDAPVLGPPETPETAPAPASPESESEWAQPPQMSEPAPPPVGPEMAEPPVSQEPVQAPSVAEPPPPESSAPSGELIPHRYEPQGNPSPSLVLPRVLSEIFGGALGGVGMGIVGLLVGASALEGVDCSSNDGVCAGTVILITVPAAFVGIPLGVQMAGQSLGGRGEFLPALGGTLLGTGVGLMYGLTAGGTGPLVLGLIVGPLAGAILGYEISNALAWRGSPLARKVSSPHEGPRVVPVVGATPRGGFLGGLSAIF